MVFRSAGKEGRGKKKNYGAEKHKHLRGHKARARIWSVLFCSKYTKEGSDVCSTVMLQRRQRKVNLVCRSRLNLAHLLKVAQGHLKDTGAQALPLGEFAMSEPQVRQISRCHEGEAGEEEGDRTVSWLLQLNWPSPIVRMSIGQRGGVPLSLIWLKK